MIKDIERTRDFLERFKIKFKYGAFYARQFLYVQGRFNSTIEFEFDDNGEYVGIEGISEGNESKEGS
jgi:hypothetical protein